MRASGVCKSFTLHAQGVTLPVLRDAAVTARRGACVALTGASGAGKSTLLRLLYGNYRIDRGRVAVRHGDGWIDLATAEPHEVLEARRLSLGYVSQFLRVIPRVPALSIVAEPMIAAGSAPEAAEARAAELLSRLRIPERLWPLSPLTFSGGEQQRVNIARGLAHSYPLLLLDEPTASLDAANRETALDLIEAAKARGAALVGIFHDAGARERLADETVDVAAFAA
ncbi:MAG: phosphonate C-P lyase system protein PhnL [Pseudomonadota bacterium]